MEDEARRPALVLGVLQLPGQLLGERNLQACLKLRGQQWRPGGVRERGEVRYRRCTGARLGRRHAIVSPGGTARRRSPLRELDDAVVVVVDLLLRTAGSGLREGAHEQRGTDRL